MIIDRIEFIAKGKLGMMLADGGRWILFLQSSAFPHRHRQPCFLSTLYVNGCMAFFSVNARYVICFRSSILN